MNVKEMLLSCNIEQAAALHLKLQQPPKYDDWDVFLQAHEDFLREIAELEPISGEYVIFGSSSVCKGKTHHNIRLYRKPELYAAYKEYEMLYGNQCPESYSETNLARIVPKALKYLYMNDHGMEMMPWEKLLGADILEDNLQSFGHDLLAALMILEMSFWGFSIEHARQGQKYARDCLQEYLSTQPPHIPPAEEIFPFVVRISIG